MPICWRVTCKLEPRRSLAPSAGAGAIQAVSAEQTMAGPILEQVTKAKQLAETDAILAALNSTRWNRKHAAALLKIDYKALLYKMKKLGVEDKPVRYPASSETPAKAVMTASGG